MVKMGSIYPYIFILFTLLAISSAQDSGGVAGVVFQMNEAPTTPLPPATEFTVYDREAMPCILVKMNMKLIIEPKRTGNKKITVPVPKSAEASGSCGAGEDSRLIVSWGSFKLLWHFQKSRVSDAWYVDNIELSYNTSDRAFGNATQDMQGQFQQIHSADPLTLFLTPLARSYSCNIPKEIKLYDDKKFSRVTMKLLRFQIQPFASMTHRLYGDEFLCPEEAGRRDETVPLMVGSLLALAVLGTIGGYGGYRYFKIKKVEYDTME